ncbi:hypothetical protein AVL56_00895 [Alteromonas stellipolaris]|jgi:hypothetical protein|uniref:YgaP family membrane protein n=1 Tax=Alteromonas TaxID=226 RepID=UPI000770598D|nr:MULTISPECIES: DUF2892 domain-containing protein [Alteromonas]AMJ92996.1 hypothetical protein AVL56_00895 [Alteromonas stellipolaris]ANB25657.1 hypothetical protein A6F57_10910 [Alteromonas stellipolaris]MDP2535413.1 DUF2892 domain-containing protein [Alteromonas stellipolaris]WOI37410.1 DUF2892 domain-containing protein [Alteromonas sp. CI.11.F.A3]
MAIQANLSLLDRSLRGAIGICVTAFAFLNGDIIDDVFIEILLGIFGGLNLISLFSGWCPVYQIAGVSTKES